MSHCVWERSAWREDYFGVRHRVHELFGGGVRYAIGLVRFLVTGGIALARAVLSFEVGVGLAEVQVSGLSVGPIHFVRCFFLGNPIV